MHISRLELENIKSYAHASFDFAHGTTAITGENGAGKTTIIESIAWVLFDLLEYKKDDFVKRGEKRGTARVTLVSGLDEREYVITRDTSAGYHVTDPQLGVRIADKKDEVVRFLWQHLGLEPGTDLRSLFRQAIGVPQGTFTAIFLEGQTERKAAFDKLLKVEEYRQAAEKLRDTSRFLDQSIASTRETIARAEGKIARAADVESELRELAAHARQTKERHDEVISKISETRRQESSLAAAAARFEAAKAAAEKVGSQLATEQVRLDLSRNNLARAQEAAQKVEDVRNDSERHLAAVAQLKALDTQRSERDRLLKQKNSFEKMHITVGSDLKALGERRDRAAAAMRESKELEPRLKMQEELEAQIGRLRIALDAARLSQSRLEERRARIEKVREAFGEAKARMHAAESLRPLAERLPEFEAEASSRLGAIADLRAELSTDERFREEMKNGFCPILTARCLNVSVGQTLEGFIEDRTAQLRNEITAAEAILSGITRDLAAAREAKIEIAKLEDIRANSNRLLSEGNQLKDEIAALEKEVSLIEGLDRETAAGEAELARLGDPRSRLKFLAAERADADELAKEIDAKQSELASAAAGLESINLELARFSDLDNSIEAAARLRDETASAHQAFTANEGLASSAPEYSAATQESAETVRRLEADLQAAQDALRKAESGYDAAQHRKLNDELIALERQDADLTAQQRAAEQRRANLEREIESFAEIRRQLAKDFKERERLELVAETTAFIRDTLKEAAPRVAKNYVHRVSLEANQLFREITGDPERSIRWAEDYSVVLEENGFERPYVSLSGGEQMSAALAIRLALLKQLSDIRIAFFDEPTTNMDEERRENFAAQIGRIKNFDQLFVISHDDTFDHYVDHQIHLSRDQRL